MDLNALLVFAKVVEAKSFSQAARLMSIPLSTVSRRVQELEDQLGVRLLERSTRSLRLTDVGADVLALAQRSAELSDAVGEVVSNQHTRVEGTLRLSAPPSVSDTLIVPLVAAFQVEYPDVRVQVLCTDRFVDPIADGIDLTFRLGPLADSSLVARRLLRYRHRLVASPAYLARHDAPKRPQDLLAHRLLTFAHWKPGHRWTFVRGSGRETLAFSPVLAMNDYVGLAHALVSGAGIGELPPVVMPELLRRGKLVEVMPRWRFRALDLSLVHLGGRHISRPLRTFATFAVEHVPLLFPQLPV